MPLDVSAYVFEITHIETAQDLAVCRGHERSGALARIETGPVP